jgi:RNA polymerase sigma-70 factor (ECF subfamily)
MTYDNDQRLLLVAAQAGDERAFRQLVEPYRHALEVHCYRFLGSAQDARDLAQETLLRAWRALERFEPKAQFQTWLYRIATNACLDELQRRPRRPEPVDPFPDRPADEAASPTYDPAARYAMREGMELALIRAIQELPGRQRAVLIFRDVLGWTAPEVAEVLESTVASVTSAAEPVRRSTNSCPSRQARRRNPRNAAPQPLRRRVRACRHDGLGRCCRRTTLRMPPQQTLEGGAEIASSSGPSPAAIRRGSDISRHRPTRPAVTIDAGR